ncbi:FAD-dependent oxidoreductase [Sediminitomix flava]|uniref:NADPH-dependent 2,4-dienoyl-CoA reductase/sulfur reductase-like enzyme n=1 Tax=Sediminitomix flava TaxID=379075 RepID=A0A315Z9D6_SEDFL|nr:FAD-dependent oxidoreductase [Sediminitomix flava]PWJ40814.1 NADPH-dependent 2,4-dienoyl-CoA reductase/sulfur reductase-like enzyme [Sediminitomix flava]
MKKQRIIVVGGLSAGPSAAAKARRVNEDAEIILFEKTANISYATCGIPYALSGKIKDRDKLMVVKPALLENRFGIEVKLNEAVNEIIPEEKKVLTAKGEYHYDKLIFATGGHSILPPIENLDKTDNWAFAKTIEDFDRVYTSGVLEKVNKITIVGAGLIGLETAENLLLKGKQVTVVEAGPQILGPWDSKFATMGQKVLTEGGVDLKLNTMVQSIDPETQNINLSDGTVLESEYMIIGISVRPNTEMLTAKGAEYIGNGALVVNERMETTLPDIYAAGDCASIPNQITDEHAWFPLGTHSNKGGRTAGANAAGGNETFKGAYGTTIMQLFDYTIARTGMGPKALKAKNMPFHSTLIISGTTPGFYPDPKDMVLEIYFDPTTKRIYGAEGFGERGVDKRIDVLATAIYAKLTIEDLPNIDFAYAPPYSPAKDPVAVAGYVAANSMNGKHKEVSVTEAAEIFGNGSDIQILDVRNPKELEMKGKVENSINIPLDQLRERMEELDPAKPTYVYCAKGLRGYLASLILTHNGFEDVSNIAGGFTMWDAVNN